MLVGTATLTLPKAKRVSNQTTLDMKRIQPNARRNMPRVNVRAMSQDNLIWKRAAILGMSTKKVQPSAKKLTRAVSALDTNLVNTSTRSERQGKTSSANSVTRFPVPPALNIASQREPSSTLPER